jgi:integrase
VTRYRASDAETRTIPIPPELVGLLRADIERYGTTTDERVFQTARGGIIQDSACSAVWAGARTEALAPAQCRSPLGRRPCDLRHAAVPLWLNSGVPRSPAVPGTVNPARTAAPSPGVPTALAAIMVLAPIH